MGRAGCGWRRRLTPVLVVLLVAPVVVLAPPPGVAVAATPQSAYASVVESDEPVGWWRLGDAGSGCSEASPCVVVNEVAGGPDGSLVGTLGAPGLAEPTDDAAVGVGGLTVEDVDLSASAFSFEVWADGAPDNHHLLGASLGGSTMVKWSSDDGASELTAGWQAPALRDHNSSRTGRVHLVVTFDGSTASLYVDGVLEDSGPASAPSWSDPDLELDSHAWTVTDEVAVYDRALSAAEVRDHWDGAEWASGKVMGGKAPWSPLVHDPVDVSSGNLVHTAGLGLPGAGGAFGLGWSAVYNSLDASGGLLGRGWSSSVDVWLLSVGSGPPDEGDVLVRLSDGRLVRFVNTGPNAWLAPGELGPGAALAFDEGSGSVPASWSLMLASGEAWEFDDEGWLVGLVDGQGQEVVVERDAGGVVEVVENAAAGRRLVVDTATAGQVEVVSQAWDGGGWVGDGRGLTYVVTDGVLDRVEAAGGAVERYTMTGGSLTRVESLVAGDGSSPSDWVLVIDNVFDGEGRVLTQTTATGEVASFAYETPESNQVTVTFDPSPGVGGDEEVTVYSMSAAGELVGVEDASGESVSKGWVGGQLGSFTDRRGADYVNVFDGEGRLSYRVWPDPATGDVRGAVVDYATPGDPAGEPPSVSAGDVFESYGYVGSGDARVAVVTARGGDRQVVYGYDGDEVVPSRVEVVDVAAEPDVVLERTCVVSDDGLVTRTIEGGNVDCSSGEVVVEYYYGSGEPAGVSVPDCPPRLLCAAGERSGV